MSVDSLRGGFLKFVPLVLVVCSPVLLVVFFAQLCPSVL
jgi:hypothetical protein